MAPVGMGLLLVCRVGGSGSVLWVSWNKGITGCEKNFLFSLPLIPKSCDCILFSFSGCNIAQKVTQGQPAMFVQEKGAMTLDCIYDTSGITYSPFWYKQLSSGATIFLILQDSHNQKNASESCNSLNFQRANNSIHLVISASQLEDSAVYICALRESTV